jgi:hypothetical protein
MKGLRHARHGISFAIALILCSWVHSQAPTPNPGIDILQSTLRTLDHVITLDCRVKRIERVNGQMESGDIRIKVNTKPHKIYVYNVNPNEGTELLWKENWNDGKVYIHPNRFPWVNVSLSPNGEQMLKDQHHHLSSTGFVCIQRVLRKTLSHYKADLDKRVTYVGKEKWYGKPHDVVKISHADYKIVNYTVQAGEDLLRIDNKLNVPSYKLLELNPDIADYFDVAAGQSIKVPTHYGKEIVLIIDPVTHLPVVQLIYDEKGLFEKYEYSEIKLNQRFSTMEFEEDNEAYGF